MTWVAWVLLVLLLMVSDFAAWLMCLLAGMFRR